MKTAKNNSLWKKMGNGESFFFSCESVVERILPIPLSPVLAANGFFGKRCRDDSRQMLSTVHLSRTRVA
ncbi:MAG: hypothetical protein MJZ96_00680 [Paludibacteraceae bacterium]|nr:hypothetical protein [Paludibacteraceae bacterium]